MRNDLYWIPAPTAGRLAIMPRPRGGDWLEDEVRAWRSAGVDVVLSLLTPGEIAELDLAEEASICNALGIEFLTFPIPDRGIPSGREAVLRLAIDLRQGLTEGKSIAIHCRQGIGRAAMIAICVLIAMGLDPKVALAQVSTARGIPVPETVEQQRWTVEFAKEPSVLVSK